MPISLEQLGHLLSAERLMTYRRMKKGVPILADFKEMVETSERRIGGNILSLVVDEGVVRAHLKVPYAVNLLFKRVHDEIHGDAAMIRAAQDDFMRAKGDKARWWKQGVPLLKTPMDSVAIPLPFRNLGSPNASGYDSSVDVGIFRENAEGQLELIVIERPELVACRPEIGTQYALIGGMTLERAARVPQVVLELLEEGISNSIGTSDFYLGAIDDVVTGTVLPSDSTKDNANQRFIRMLLSRDAPEQSAKEKCIAYLARLSCDDSVDGKQAKAKYALALLSVVDEYKKLQNPGYETLANIITQHVESVKDAEGRELRLFNRADHRMTSQALNQTAMHTLLVGDSLATLLRERGLSFVGGDDAAHVTHVSVHDFLRQGWGGHPELMVQTMLSLQAHDASTLSPDQLLIKEQLVPEVMDYIFSETFLEQMEHFAKMLLDEIDEVNGLLDKLDGVSSQQKSRSSEASLFSTLPRKRSREQGSLERLQSILEGHESSRLALETLAVSFPDALHPGMTACEALSMMLSHCHALASDLRETRPLMRGDL
ncbi:MAG: hypothetical protein ACOYKA_00810 [Legionellaceae bacterium]